MVGRHDDDRHEPGATESQVERIEGIKGDEVLGYQGESPEEHSGEPSRHSDHDDQEDGLADNRPDQVLIEDERPPAR